jgi:hypothetical protein
MCYELICFSCAFYNTHREYKTDGGPMTFPARWGASRSGLVLAVVLCLALVSVIPVSAGWSYEVVGSMYPWTPGTEQPGQVSGTITSHPISLVVGSDGNSRISYLDENQHLAYAERMNGKWITSTVDATIPAGASSLALTHNNVPGISYYDTKARGLMYAYKLYGSWKTESVEGNWAGPYSSLVYNEYGLPMVSYYSDGTAADLQVQKFAQRDPNQWYRKTPEGGAAGMFTALALNATGSPVIGLYDAGSKRLKYVYRADKGKWTEDPWVADRVVDSGNVGQYLSLAIDSKNVLHFSYYNETGKSLKYAEGKSGGVDVGFNLVTVDTGNAGKYTSLSLDSSGTPHISYWDDSRQILKYAVRNADGTWKKSEIWPWHSGTTQRQVSSLAIGPDNVPRISYIEYFDGTANLIYAEWVPDKPSPDVVVFGDTRQLVKVPLGTDYRTVGGLSAIRRNGSIETFTGGFTFRSSGWVDVTNGAAITANGDLATWKATAKSGPVTFTPASEDKKYVSVSQYSDGDWLLAIYKDAKGATHLEASGNPAKHPEVFGNIPKDTGWKLIAAGKDHALAVRSNGSLVAWGKNNVGQLDLPNSATYTDVAAGYDFSIGLAAGNTGTSEYLYAAGRDDYGQVSKAPKDPAPFIQIAAGPTTGAALTHNGHILIWGKNLTGAPVPTDGGYTAISLGPDLGFALRDYAPELHITGPLSPDTNVVSREGTKMHIPKGARFEHTGNGVMRVIAPNGTVLFWVNDDEAAQVTFPEGTTFPSSAIHYLPKQSLILIPENYEATVYGTDTPLTDFLKMAEQPPLMNVTAATWRDEQNASSQQLTPQGVCFADTGCSAGATSRGQLFLSAPLTPINVDIPVFSVQKFNDTMYIGTLSTLGSTNPANDRKIHLEKNRIDPDQPVKFNIMKNSAGTASTADVVVMATANLTNQNSALHYTITGSASVATPEINITPKIWKKTDTGDVLVYTGEKVTCSAAMICIAAGNFTPKAPATYLVNATVLYTMPTNAAVPEVAVALLDGGAATLGYDDRYVFIEEGNDDTCMGGDLQDFRDDLYAKVTDPHGWKKPDNVNDIIYAADARPKHWINGTSFPNKGNSKDYLDKADFAYFHGHGNDGTVDFDNKDSAEDRYYLAPDRARWGTENGSRIKWITFHSCRTLNGTTWTNWKQSFDGLHILLGYNSSATCPSTSTGGVYAQLMRGAYTEAGTTVQTIYNSWWNSNRYTVKDKSRQIGVIYVDGCLGDYLPGYGSYGSNCVPKRNSAGTYTLKYDNQTAAPMTMSKTDSTLLKTLPVEKTQGKYSLNASIVQVPASLMVYTPVKPGYDLEYAARLSRELGMSGQINDTSVVYENADHNPNAPLFVVQKNARIILYQDIFRSIGSPLKDGPENIPSDADAVKKVTDFLIKTDLMPLDAVVDGTGHHSTEQLISPTKTEIVGDKIVVFLHREINGIPVENSQITAEVGADSDITDLFMNWRDYAPYRQSATKSIDSAFTEFTQKHLSYYPAMEPENIIVNDISLIYYSHPAADKETYLQPAYVFEGYIQNGETSEPFDPVYIPATTEQFDNIPGCRVNSCT